MSVVYPISADIPIEDEDDTRKRIEGLHRQAIKERKEKRWRPEELEMLYRECCRVREEHPLKKMRLVFEVSKPSQIARRRNFLLGSALTLSILVR